MVQEIRSLQKLAIFFRVSRWGRRGGGGGGGGLYAVLYGNYYAVMHTDDHICMYIRTCIHVHMYSYTYIRTYKRTHVHTYVRTYIHMYTHVHMYSYIHTSVHTHVYTYICTHTYVRTYTYTLVLHSPFYNTQTMLQCVCREFGYLALVHARSEVGRAARILLTVYGVHRGQGGDRLLAEVHTNTEMDSQWTQEGERWRLISYRGKERPVK